MAGSTSSELHGYSSIHPAILVQQFHVAPMYQPSHQFFKHSIRFMTGLVMLLLALGWSSQAWTREPQLNLPRIQLQAGMHLITAQVANTPQQRSTGLMWRHDMAPNEGMIFVFETPQRQCFWMQNTFIPLTAAFLDEDGTIVNLADMQPLSTESHCSAKPVRFVLEMHRGWFAQRGIAPGQRLRGTLFAEH